MWQRSQTLYLAIATVLSGLLFFCDKAGEIRYTAYVPYLILTILITLLEFLALTTWKFRVFQFRTANLAAILSAVFQIWLGVDFFVTGNSPAFHISAVFPVVLVILDIMAARGIWADEMMVQSVGRLRSSRRNSHRKASGRVTGNSGRH